MAFSSVGRRQAAVGANVPALVLPWPSNALSIDDGVISEGWGLEFLEAGGGAAPAAPAAAAYTVVRSAIVTQSTGVVTARVPKVHSAG